MSHVSRVHISRPVITIGASQVEEFVPVRRCDDAAPVSSSNLTIKKEMQDSVRLCRCSEAVQVQA